jgi:hypothetical protein
MAGAAQKKLHTIRTANKLINTLSLFMMTLLSGYKMIKKIRQTMHFMICPLRPPLLAQYIPYSDSLYNYEFDAQLSLLTLIEKPG